MQRLGNGIDANALTGLQGAWGGTHDALLGLLLWMYRIPTHSLNRYCMDYRMMSYTILEQDQDGHDLLQILCYAYVACVSNVIVKSG
jgi:hypothetical protein